jgi:CheY-like chemotaxis protein
MNNSILIVEDDKDIREVYELVLRHNGYTVCTAVNGQEALTALDKCQPRLILLDIFMPVMDGETFIKTVDMSKYPDASIVVCSNTNDQELMDRMLKLGAQQVVTKSSMAPNDLADLVAPYFA